MALDLQRLRPLLLPWLALLAGALGMSALWSTLAALLMRPLAWMALVCAFDLVLMLRLSGLAPGRRSAGMASAGTLACIALSYWFNAASVFGDPLGLRPWEAAQRLGPVLALEITRLQAGRWDPALLAAALMLAAIGGGFDLSGRRRPPSTRPPAG